MHLAWILFLFGLLGVDAPTSSVEPEAQVSEAARRQVERVMNAGLPFAERMLAEHGEFAPFGAVMLSSGLIRVVGANEEPQQLPIEEIFDRLARGIRDGVDSGDSHAVATFALVDMHDEPQDRIVSVVHVALEHRDGYCVDVFYPTVVRGKGIALGEAFAGKRAGTFFDACAAP